MLNNVYHLKMMAEEYFYTIALDSKMIALGVFEVSHGTANYSVAQPMEVYIRALLCGAVNIVIAHNHPSGSPSPSSDDFKITQIMKTTGELIGIKLIDHIIVAGTEYYSFKENNNL